MKRFAKVYLEISNLCNLSCAFCPGTRRPKGAMDPQAFRQLLEKLRPWTDHLYFHLMGEPLLHPQLALFLRLAGDAGFKVILTTNGTLLPRQQELLLASPGLHKVNISLQALEANGQDLTFPEYLAGCIAFGQAAQGKKLVCYRLWNSGGEDALNPQILQALARAFPLPWTPARRGQRLGDGIYLEPGEKFDWPDLGAPAGDEPVFCYGLRDQLGVLWDGTVVPCCLDHEGDIPLGNLLTQELEQILASPRARALYEGFSQRRAVEPLCRSCGYARRFG